MIGRVYRGGRVGGLLRYLYGPGRHNEHSDPHLVASWDGGDEQALAALEPAHGDAGHDVRPLADDMDAPLAYSPRKPSQPVWHCPLRTAPGDRRLTDAEWRDVAEDLMHRTGIAPRGDDGACRWVAVRHDDDSIHVVAVLARQDGGSVRLWRDYHRVRETCLAAEQKLGLTVTAPIDGTATPAVSRAETEKAARTGRPEEPRVRLRREVRYAVLGATSTEDFLSRVRAAGILVRERFGLAGDLTGYAVAVPGDVTAEGLPVWYGGGRLSPDLTLPRVSQRWGQSAVVSGSPKPAPGAPSATVDRAQLIRLLERDVNHAARSGKPTESDLYLASDSLQILATLIEGRGDGALTEAAELFARSVRTSRGAAGHHQHVAALTRVRRLTNSSELQASDQLLLALMAFARALARQHASSSDPMRAGTLDRIGDLLSGSVSTTASSNIPRPSSVARGTGPPRLPGHETSTPARRLR